MKIFALLFTYLHLTVVAAVPVEDINSTVDATPPDLTRIPDGVFLEPSLSEQETPLKDGATLKVLKYGPYRVGALGSLENRMSFGLAKPCTGGCYIVGIQANLVHASSGKTANIDEGAWLHHMVIYNTGLGRTDAVCTTPPLPIMGQRIFASGNERTPIRTNGKDNKYGIEFRATDSLSMIYDLMNESKQSQSYYIEMVSNICIRCRIQLPLLTIDIDV
jgi:hypothetical protein